jgi:hypothetical protein
MTAEDGTQVRRPMPMVSAAQVSSPLWGTARNTVHVSRTPTT